MQASGRPVSTAAATPGEVMAWLRIARCCPQVVCGIWQLMHWLAADSGGWWVWACRLPGSSNPEWHCTQARAPSIRGFSWRLAQVFGGRSSPRP